MFVAFRHPFEKSSWMWVVSYRPLSGLKVLADDIATLGSGLAILVNATGPTLVQLFLRQSSKSLREF
jgi:hypothetical protein